MRESHFPVGVGSVALLLGDNGGKSVIALCVQAGAELVGIGAFQIGFRRGDIFVAVAVDALFVFGLGLSCGSAGFGNFFRTIPAPCFFGVGAGLCERGSEFLVVKSDQDLPGLDRIALPDKTSLQSWDLRKYRC